MSNRNFKFTIPAGQNPGSCVANGEARFTCTTEVLLHKGKLIATDGRVLSVVPVTVEGEGHDVPLLLPADGVKALKGNAATVHVNGKLEARVGKKTALHDMPEMEGRFPPVAQVIPGNLENTVALTLDVNMLADLAKAISSDGIVTLFLQVEDGAVNKPVAAVAFKNDWNNKQTTGIGLIVPLFLPQEPQARKAYLAERHDRFREVAKGLPSDTIRFELPKAAPEAVAIAA